MSNDLYSVLGLQKNATDAEIKSAYRKLAMKHHPDRNQGNKESETEFKKTAAAYEVLKDKKKRQEYDTYGSVGGDFGGGSHSGGSGGFEDFGGMNFNDIFSDIFGGGRGGRSSGGRRASSAVEGSDLRYNIEVTLSEAYQGLEKNIEFSAKQKCSSCNGNGCASGKKPNTCTTCSGAGKVRMQQGFFVVEQTCSTCHGAGEMIKDPCLTCSGQGRINKKKKLKVKIPAGVDNGTRIRLDGEGESGFRGGNNGDLYLFVSVKRHKIFIREESNIICHIPIKITTAILGGSVKVTTISGENVELKIPSGTNVLTKFKLKNKGMPNINSGLYGDMLVQIDIDIPKKISAKQKDLLQELDEELELSPSSKNIFDKFKDIFK